MNFKACTAMLMACVMMVGQSPLSLEVNAKSMEISDSNSLVEQEQTIPSNIEEINKVTMIVGEKEEECLLLRLPKEDTTIEAMQAFYEEKLMEADNKNEKVILAIGHNIVSSEVLRGMFEKYKSLQGVLYEQDFKQITDEEIEYLKEGIQLLKEHQKSLVFLDQQKDAIQNVVLHKDLKEFMLPVADAIYWLTLTKEGTLTASTDSQFLESDGKQEGVKEDKPIQEEVGPGEVKPEESITINPATIQIPVEAIQLEESEKTVRIGETFDIKVLLEPQDATQVEVVWTSSDQNIVMVENNKLKALAKGEATLTATTENGLTASCKIKVVKYRYAIEEGVWKKNSKGYYYEFPDKSYLYSDWGLIKGKWYYFDDIGYMKTGWLKDKGRWYYLEESGAMVTGFKTLGASGILLRAQLEVGYEEKASNKDLDYFDKNPGSGNYTKYARDLNNAGLSGFQGQPWCGVYQMWLEYMTYGKETALKHLGPYYYNVFSTMNWSKNNGRWLSATQTPQVGDCVIFSQSHVARVTGVTGTYYNGTIFTNEGNTSDGINVSRDGGKVCAKSYSRNNPKILGYVSVDHGAIENNWNPNGPETYYFNANGSMATGWVKEDNTWYYMNNSGIRQTGWVKVNGKWYFLDNNGKMEKGWLNKDKQWYYLEDSGAMATGWKKVENKWYYLMSSGKMVTGWIKVNNVWYYMKQSGAMVTGWVKVANEWYYMQGSGAMTTGWQTVKGSKYYLKPSGAMATGWYRIDGVSYYFSPTTGAFTGRVR